jgi:hypothetical protein
MEMLAAELTSAAYNVVMRHGVGDKWLDVQLALWKALTDEIKKAEREYVANTHDLPNASDFFG